MSRLKAKMQSVLQNKTIQKVFQFLVLGVLVLYVINQGKHGGDFQIYLGAAELLKNGENCYNVWITLDNGEFCGYSYSPFFALLLIPLTFLPQNLPQILWLLANLWFLTRSYKLFKLYLPLSSFSVKRYRIWFILGLLLSIRFILHNFEMIQMTIFLVYICLEMLYQVNKGNNLFAGFLLALGVIVKIVPIVFIPYLIYRKTYKPVLFGLLFILAFLLAPA